MQAAPAFLFERTTDCSLSPIITVASPVLTIIPVGSYTQPMPLGFGWQNPSKFIGYVILKTSRDTALEERMHFLEKPDLIVYQVTDKISASDVNILDIDETLSGSKPLRVFMVGCPSDKNRLPFFMPNTESAVALYQPSYNLLYSAIVQDSLPSGWTKSDYVQRFSNLNFLVSSHFFREGMSGSPVFGEYRVDGRVRIKFMGIAFGRYIVTRNEGGVGEIVKANQLQKYLDGLE